MKQIYEEFRKTDLFYARFKRAFQSSIIDVVLDFHPEFKQIDVLNELILLYATEIISAAESVIDKDLNYPEHRKLEELNYMKRITSKENVMMMENDFSAHVHLKAKEQVVQFFPHIMDLSNHGFRLLEQNTKMYLFSFISQFNSFSNNA